MDQSRLTVLSSVLLNPASTAGTKMKIEIILLFIFYFCLSPVLSTKVKLLKITFPNNEEFIPEDSEDSSTVHVGTAMFCQVGSEVCLHFEVNLLA